MSKVQLAGNASGTGIFTIASPNSNTDRTLTLPDNTGTLLTSGSAITRSQLPSGTVLQVVTAQINARYSTSSGSFAGIGPTLSITPTSSSSRILLITSLSIQYGGYTYMTFLRNGTNVSGAANGIITYPSATSWNNTSFNYVDSPATTSAITYQVGMYVSSGTTYLNDNSAGNNSQLIAMEIA